MVFFLIKVVIFVLNFTYFLTSAEPLTDIFDRKDDFNSTLKDFSSKSSNSRYRRRYKQWLIIGGEHVNVTDIPYMVSVRSMSVVNHTSGYLCAGTVLTQNFILTAAHCLMDTYSNKSDLLPFDDIEIRSGSNSPFEGGTLHGVTKVCLPPNLKQVKNFTSSLDLAVVKVVPAIDFSGAAGSVHLPNPIHSSRLMDMVDKEEECIMTGFGNNKTDKYALMIANVKLMPYKSCRKMYGKRGMTILKKDHVCTFGHKVEGMEGECSEDSGGALVCSKHTRNIWGVAAIAYNCTSSAPRIFTRVDTKEDFIRNCMDQNKSNKFSVTDKLRPSGILATVGVLYNLVVFHLNVHSFLRFTVSAMTLTVN